MFMAGSGAALLSLVATGGSSICAASAVAFLASVPSLRVVQLVRLDTGTFLKSTVLVDCLVLSAGGRSFTTKKSGVVELQGKLDLGVGGGKSRPEMWFEGNAGVEERTSGRDGVPSGASRDMR